MHARAVATASTALVLGTAALLLATSGAQADATAGPPTVIAHRGASAYARGYVSAVHGFTGPHGKPLEVFTWTVDDAQTARRVAGYRVDGVIANKPDVVRDAVERS